MSGNDRRARTKVHNPTSTTTTSGEQSGCTTPTSVDSLRDTTPVDYLFKSNITSIMTESINHLIMTKPDDPIAFLVDYFASSSYDVVNEAYTKLSWTHFGRKSYERNILQVYDTLVNYENTDSSSLRGLLGNRFNRLLTKLSADLPPAYGNKCLAKIESRDSEVITFDRFQHAILFLHVMKDFIVTVRGVYKDLDLYNMGKCNEAMCNVVLDSLCAKNKQKPEMSNGVAMVTEKLTAMNMKECGKEEEKVVGGSCNTNSLMRDLQELIESTSSEQYECMEEKVFVDKAVDIFINIV